MFFFVPHGVPSERTRKLGADRAPGRRFSFGANQQKHSSDLRPPLSGRSIPLLFFKARARQQKLEPPAIGPWRRPVLNGCQIFLAGSKGLIKPVSGPESIIAHFHSKPFRCRGARSGPNLSGRRQATPYDASLTTLGFGVSGSTGFCRRNLEI